MEEKLSDTMVKIQQAALEEFSGSTDRLCRVARGGAAQTYG